MIRKYVRLGGLALIALPEPFTTVIGVGMVVASYTMFKPKPLRKFRNLDELAKRSLKGEEPNDISTVLASQHRLFHKLDPDPKKIGKTKTPRVFNWRISSNFKKEQDRRSTNIVGKSCKKSAINLIDIGPLHKHPAKDPMSYHTLRTSFPQYEAPKRALPKNGSKALSRNTSLNTQMNRKKASPILISVKAPAV